MGKVSKRRYRKYEMVGLKWHERAKKELDYRRKRAETAPPFRQDKHDL